MGNRGGARAGAGRKRAVIPNCRTIRLTDEELEALTARAIKNETNPHAEMRCAIRRYLGLE